MFKAFLYFIFAVLIITVVGVGLLYLTAPSRYNVLIVGSDQRGTEASRSDVLMVLSISKKKNGGVNLLSIPRDSYVEVEGHGMQKITHAYGYDKEAGAILGNIDLTQQTVEEFLDIPIHASIQFTFQSFVDFIDDLGGVEFNGKIIDGESALAKVRNRDRAGGDFARAEDQRQIFLSILPHVTSLSGAQDALAFFQGHPESHISYSRTSLVHFGIGYVLGNRSIKPPTGGIEEYTIPGENDRIYTEEFGKELYYWVPDEEATKELIEEYFK